MALLHTGASATHLALVRCSFSILHLTARATSSADLRKAVLFLLKCMVRERKMVVYAGVCKLNVCVVQPTQNYPLETIQKTGMPSLEKM